jgi:hypothetical protein
MCYSGTVHWPAVTSDVRQGEALPGPVASLDAANPSWDLSAYTIVAQGGLGKTQVATAAYALGAVIQIYLRPRGGGNWASWATKP